MKVLITGIAGFAGSHLAELALAQGAEVAGTFLPGAPVDNLARVAGRVTTLPCDLTEPGAAARVLAEARPDRLFHLAGASVVGTSWTRRAEVLRANLESAFQVLEALRAHPVPCLLVSSGEVYGLVPETDQPITEARPIAPVSPYALSKACLELYAGYYARAEGVPVVVVRAFNHVGPGQGHTDRPQQRRDRFLEVAALEVAVSEPRVSREEPAVDFLAPRRRQRIGRHGVDQILGALER